MKDSQISQIRLAIRTWKCSCCKQLFYEMHEYEIEQCPSCSALLSNYAPEQLDQNDQFVLQVDPYTGKLSLINTVTGDLVTQERWNPNDSN